MEHPLPSPRVARSSVRVGLAAALALVSGLAAWALLTRGSTPPASPQAQVRVDGSRIVSADGLSALAGLRGTPIYWAGARANALYEVTETANGFVYVRYLPSGTAPGDPRSAFLTVGSYTRSDAFGDIKAAARRPGAVSLTLPQHGLAVYDRNKPTSVYLAYPGSTEQIEVYDPSPSRALRLVESGRIRPVP